MIKKIQKFFTFRIIIFVLITFTQNVAAENWVKFGENESGETTNYIEVDSIKVRDGFTYYWLLSDRKTATSTGSKSRKAYYKLDCDFNRQMPITVSFYSENMGSGTVKSFEPSSEWEYPIPGSLGGETFNFVCFYDK